VLHELVDILAGLSPMKAPLDLQAILDPMLRYL
jgi:hypothetical protein